MVVSSLAKCLCMNIEKTSEPCKFSSILDVMVLKEQYYEVVLSMRGGWQDLTQGRNSTL